MNIDYNALNVYTDGSSKGSPRVGGIGIRLVFPESLSKSDNVKNINVPGYKNATNNQMELQACIIALEKIMKLDDLKKIQRIVINTDSMYVVGNYKKAIWNWSRNKWKKSSGGPVLNAELWKQLIRNMKKIGVRVDIYYVKGHSKSKHNKEADKLAKKSANKCRNKQLSVVNLRRKLSNKSVLLGSVKMSGQKIKIRIISSSYLKTQRIKKYKYEVISKKSKFYKCVDQIYGDKNIKTLRVGHSYLVSLNKNNMYPQVSKVFCDITEKN